MATQRDSINSQSNTQGAIPIASGTTTPPNVVKRSRQRESKTIKHRVAEDRSRELARARSSAENSIRQSKRRVVNQRSEEQGPANKPPVHANGHDRSQLKQHGAQSKVSSAPKLVAATTNDPDAIPAQLQQQFVQVGRKYYFPDGARAFTDHGHKLTTPSENTEVIRSLVTIAHARGWNDITVTGTERFRKEAWFAAKLAGLEVKGYQPTQFEQGHLVRIAARASLARGTELAEARPASLSTSMQDDSSSSSYAVVTRQRRGFIAGRLVDHGRATYHHDPSEPVSYFVKIETPRGERTLWGIDFERAFRESLTKPALGDAIGVRAVRQEAVTVKAREWGPDGKVLGEKDLATHRNRWIVEKESFFASRAAAAQAVRDPKIDPRKGVREHPELAGTYLYLKGAKEVAKRRIRDPADQRKFVATVRHALAESVARGEPLPPVRLRERTGKERTDARSTRSTDRRPALVRE